jgi:hypothetical protein
MASAGKPTMHCSEGLRLDQRTLRDSLWLAWGFARRPKTAQSFPRDQHRLGNSPVVVPQVDKSDHMTSSIYGCDIRAFVPVANDTGIGKPIPDEPPCFRLVMRSICAENQRCPHVPGSIHSGDLRVR